MTSSPIAPRDKNESIERPKDIFSAMRSEMERMFERFSSDWPNLPQIFNPAGERAMLPSLDFKDEGNAFVIEAELPGVDEKDVTVSLTDRVLTIKGEKRQSSEKADAENHYVKERTYGSFTRSLQLPQSVDDSTIKASFDRGVLKITAEKRSVPGEKKIEIKSSPTSAAPT